MDTTPFTVLLRDSLKTSVNDELLVIYDESLAPFWNPLLCTVQQIECPTTFVHLPVSYQQQLSCSEEIRMPTGILTAIDEVDVIVTILSGDINLARVRRAIINKASGFSRPGNRLAHIPGISSEVLEVLTRSPISKIEEECELVAWALGEGFTATLITQDCEGRSYELLFDLGGWFNEPLISPGVIYHGSWGNVPPGETFCCPAPRSVSGSVVINGSVPGYVCQEREEVILEFIEGKLVNWYGKSPPLTDFFDRLRDVAETRRDPHWNTFAELGIGLNPAVTHLTGNSLFDEKAHGTVHIAIGDNSTFGHSVESHIHADLVIREPSLAVDHKWVIQNGCLLADDIVNRRNQLAPLPIDPATLRQVQVRAETFESTPVWTDAFARRLHSRGRTGYVRVAKNEDATLLRRMYEAIATEDAQGPQSPARLRAIADQLGIQTSSVSRLLGLLVHYRMVYVDPDPLVAPRSCEHQSN